MTTPAIVSKEAAELVTYAYSYPHKSSYRPLREAVPLADAWRDEDQSRLALYVHLPFCEMRCGFCNLLTQSQPEAGAVEAYLSALFRQMSVVRDHLPDAGFRQFAVGGGTPTFLSAPQLDVLFREVEARFQVAPAAVPTSVETSPATATFERLRILSERRVERISLGVQSFVDADAQRIGRPQRSSAVHAALEAIRALKFPILNIDLIYGGPGQSRAAWLESLVSALEYRPEELFLYPLYVRPETGFARTGCDAARHQVDLYRLGRELLLDSGYQQISLRSFKRAGQTGGMESQDVGNPSAADYCCQHDGMVGLGCGGRSYTRALHYASRFAVTQAGIRALLQDWIAQSNRDLALATHGIHLNAEEQRRRFVILSVLHVAGLCEREYEARFQSTPLADVSELGTLIERGWVDRRDGRFVLTEAGMENSDLAGPALYSTAVRSRLLDFVRL